MGKQLVGYASAKGGPIARVTAATRLGYRMSRIAPTDEQIRRGLQRNGAKGTDAEIAQVRESAALPTPAQ